MLVVILESIKSSVKSSENTEDKISEIVKENSNITIKDIESKLGDTSTILNSFILSNTSLNTINELHTNLTYKFFEDKNVLFQKDKKNSYIRSMFNKILQNTK